MIGTFLNVLFILSFLCIIIFLVIAIVLAIKKNVNANKFFIIAIISLFLTTISNSLHNSLQYENKLLGWIDSLVFDLRRCFIMVFVIYIFIFVYKLIRKKPKRKVLIVGVSALVLFVSCSIGSNIINNYQLSHPTEEQLKNRQTQEVQQATDKSKLQQKQDKMNEVFGTQGVEYINKVQLLNRIIGAHRMNIDIEFTRVQDTTGSFDWGSVSSDIKTIQESILMLSELTPTSTFLTYHTNLLNSYDVVKQGLLTANDGISMADKSVFNNGLNKIDLGLVDISKLNNQFNDYLDSKVK